MRPLDEACRCPASRSYSRAYLHHLTYYQDLMAGLRLAIAEGELDAFTESFAAEQELGA